MAEHETIADIIADKRREANYIVQVSQGKCQTRRDKAEDEARDIRREADRLEAAHKREVDALKQRCAKLDAEVAAKDEVIKRLNDAISEWQRRKMETPENSSAVGDAAKLPKTVDLRFDICQNIELVLKIGRDYQNKDGYRGAHYDTVKLLCDAIEYQQEQLKTKTKVGDEAKLREACAKAAESAAEIMERVRYKDVLAFNTANYIAGIAKDALAAEKEGGAT